MQEGETTNINYNILYCIFIGTALYYSLQITNDIGSNLLLFLAIISLTSLFNKQHHRYLLALFPAVLTVDIVGKIVLSIQHSDSLLLLMDTTIVKDIIFIKLEDFNVNTLVYLTVLLSSWFLPFLYNVKQKSKVQSLDESKFFRFVSYCLDYITPILLYALCYTKLSKHSFRQWLETIGPDLQLGHWEMLQQVGWSLVTALCLLARQQNTMMRRVMTILLSMMIIRDQSVERFNQSIRLYNLQWRITAGIKVCLVLFFRMHNKTDHITQIQDDSDEQSQTNRMSSHRKFSVKRKNTLRQDLNPYLTMLLILLTIFTMILTNGLGNIIVIIGIALNLPNYQETQYRMYLAFGITISLLLQPTQFIYVIFLYAAKHITTFDQHFNPSNWWLFIELGRIVILLSKVSLLNFLIGLFQSQYLVMFTLIFRNACSFFKLILVFMGTEDNYQYLVSNIIPSSISSDILLWAYLLFLKLYSPASSIKFNNTEITDIFKEYPIVNYFQKTLKILKIFHWIAYSAISLLILNSQPSLFTLLRIIPLLIAFIVGILQSQKSQWLQRLWNWNFYTSLSIAFVKYFYLLSQYDNLSPWLITLLTPLIQNYKFIGLTPPDNNSLWVTFGPDFIVILINAIVLFVIKVELSQTNYLRQRQRIIQQQHLQDKLIVAENELEVFNEKNIHYLYFHYIKSIEFKFKDHSKFRPFLTDFILDLAFVCFLAVFALYPNHQYSLYYIPHFLAFFIGYLRQNGKHNLKYIFQILIGISSLDLFSLYVFYFIALVNGTESHYDLLNLFCKYLFLIFSVLFNQTNSALVKFYRQNKVVRKAEHSFFIYKLMTPSIPSEKAKKQVISLYLHMFKTLAISFYISALIEGSFIIKISHFLGLTVIFIMGLLPCTNTNEFYKTKWIYYFIFTLMIDIWAGQFYTFICLLFIRGYSMMLAEFGLVLAVQKYGITNKTSNQQMKKRVEDVENKYAPDKDQQGHLDAISQVKSLRQKSSYMSLIEDEIVWKYQNIYNTILWLLPLLFALQIQLGVLFYLSHLFGFVFFILSLAAILHYLTQLEQQTIQSKLFRIIIIVLAVLVVLSIVYKIMYLSHDLSSYGFGLFMIFNGLLGYYQFWRYSTDTEINRNYQYSYYIDFSQKRSQEAIAYWKKKCQLVSQLGSQIHNQKKMVSLRKFFLNRQNLSVKVEQLTEQLKQKSAHRKSRFQSLQKLEEQEGERQVFKKEQFEVYSNMLTFMSIQDLQYCYLQLNQYFKGQNKGQSKRQSGSIEVDLAKSTREVREWILNHYEHSVSETLTVYLREILKTKRKISLQQIQEEIQRAEQEAGQSQQIMSIKRSLKFLEYAHQHVLVETKQPIKDLCGERIDQRLSELSWIVRKFVQNIQILGLIVTAGWNFFGGVYTIPANIVIFSWAIVLQTKTTVIFWFFLLVYTATVLAFKFILSYLPSHLFINFIFYYHPNDYLYEFFIILVCVIEIVFLKMGGTSNIAYSQRQNIFDAFYRNLLNQAAKGKHKPAQGQFLDIYKQLRYSNKHSFFYRVFSKGRLKPGKDLYPLLAIVQLIILLYIFFFYDMMEFQSKNNRKSLGQILTVTQFSKNMIFALFFQVIIMISDRIIVSLNWIDSFNQKLQNFFFNVIFKDNLRYSSPQKQDLQRMNKFDYLLILKYLFHVIMLVAINFFVYFYIPSGGMQKSIIPQCQNAVCGKSYTYLSIFLFLYLLYFVISGLQIKHGFNRNKCRNTLMERYHWVDYYLYMFFTGVPFLWEFKKISDWTTTSTALPLFHWMKFQDINARMYQSKCQAQILKIKQLGKGPWYKYFIGPPGFLFILVLIFSPIIMYSSFNPFAVKDSILAASFKFQLVRQKNNIYNFFETSHTSIRDDESIEGSHSKILGLFDRASLFKLQASSFPDQDFMLSEPAVQQLSDNIKNTYQRIVNTSFQMRLSVTVAEKEGGDSNIQWGSKKLNHSELEGLYRLINSNQTQLQIQGFYSPFPGEIANQSIYITTHNQGQYFQLQTSRLSKNSSAVKQNKKGVFIYYKSSVKYKIGIGLFTFYLTYVVLINSLFRFYLTGGLQNILFEGCELQKILFLCEAVRSARILQNFVQQEYLYFSLVDLMRYPKMINDIADDFSNMRKPHKD